MEPMLVKIGPGVWIERDEWSRLVEHTDGNGEGVTQWTVLELIGGAEVRTPWDPHTVKQAMAEAHGLPSWES